MDKPTQFRILIVEDEVDTAEIQAVELRDHGLQVEIVNNGNDAIPKMKSWHPHLVVLDLELPGKNGVDILHELKRDADIKETLVIGNSIHMDSKDDLGRRFYEAFVYHNQEDPLYVNKLSPNEAMNNNLTALVGIALGEKFGVLPKGLGDYLTKLKSSQNSKNPSKDWQIIQ